MKKYTIRISMAAALIVVVLSACRSATKTTPTPTQESLEAISTQAAQTAFFQLTQLAQTQPPTATNTNTPEMTATATPAPPTLTPPPPVVASCANYKFVSETIPDGTQMAGGQVFTKTWRVQNSGTCDWTTSFKIVYVQGEAMGGTSLAMASTVPVGQQVDLSVKLTAPNKSGQLKGWWYLFDDRGLRFGDAMWVTINVGVSSPTPTGTLTISPTATSTSTETPTPSATPTL